ncbi:MAG: DUF4185 domain-containing protein [Sphingobacteriaceae bacterium]
MKNYFFFILFLSWSLFILPQSFAQVKKRNEAPVDLEKLKFSVTEAADWTALFKRQSGWFGGDGIYTISLNGLEGKQASAKDSVLILFSDSMIGAVVDDSLVAGSVMIHNAVAVLQGDKPIKDNIDFYWNKDEKGKPETVFVPKTKQTEQGDYYWLGDGFVNQELNNSLYIFGYRVKTVNGGAFGFKEVGNTLIKIKSGSLPPYQDVEQMDTPFYISDEHGESGSFGAGIYVNTRKAGASSPDGFVYIYGVRGQKKELMIARVLPKYFEDFDQWTFLDGENWVSDIRKAAAITDGVSNELSLTALPDGRYALVFQIGGITPIIGMRIASNPAGPFGPVIKIWDCKQALVKPGYFVYNAKAHPSLSKSGEIIISYNVNSFDFFKDLKNDPNLYRPRFIRLKLID